MLRSPPSRRRGLKSFPFVPVLVATSRLLHGGVDWNLTRRLEIHSMQFVASFTEAWIEINLGKNENEGEQVASFTEAWIEISSQMVWNLLFLASPPSWRHGLKSREGLYLYRKSRRLLRGGVDWNTEIFVLYRVILVASFTEAWIEISRKIWNHIEEHTSPPSRRRGLK